MLIGIDAHNLEGKRTGVGRYVFNLLKEWGNAVSFPRRRESIVLEINQSLDSRFHGNDKKENINFILYFKDEIPADLPKSDLYKYKLLKVSGTAKFIHWDLPRAAEKDKIDILFCPAYIAPLWYKGKIALTLHDIIYEAHPEWFNWPGAADRILLKWVSKKAAKKATIIFTPSEFTRQEVIKYYQVAPDKIITTPLAVDPVLSEKFRSPMHETKIKALKEKYGIKDKFIFFVGSIFSRRHLLEIISTLRRLAKEKPDYQFLAAGRDYTPDRSVEKIIQAINQELNFPAILRVDHLADTELKLLYSACAFFIWLSDYEGFGLPVIEAMSVGAPVITSDAASLKEVAGQAALLIRNNADTDEIYQAMKRLAENEDLRQELARQGKEQAAKFSWQRCAEETLNGLLNSPSF